MLLAHFFLLSALCSPLTAHIEVTSSEVVPTSWEDIKDAKFYIINGQHTWAAVKRMFESTETEQVLKDDYEFWECNFVWTKDKLALSELARRINNTNQFKWESPEYLAHIQYARDLWTQYGMPTPASQDNYKVIFHWMWLRSLDLQRSRPRPSGRLPNGNRIMPVHVMFPLHVQVSSRDAAVVPVGNCPLGIETQYSPN